MDRKTRSILVALLLLLAAELGLRALDDGPQGALPGERPIVLLLGSSRSRGGLSPEAMEQALEQRGIRAPWVANLSQERVTTVGLHEQYMREVHPLSERSGSSAVVVAIEVRAGGLNDSYLTPEEAVYAERFRPLSESGAELSAGARTAGPLELLLEGRFAAASRALLGNLRLARGDEILRPRLAALLRQEGDPGGGGAPFGLDAEWAHGTRGWRPYPDEQEPGLRAEMWREVARTISLKDFTLGGVQTEFLRLLVRQVRADGFVPVLYCMPITGIHRGFFEPGDYSVYLLHVKEVAASERVPFVDLDSALDLSTDAFVDTHHLRFGAVAFVSEQLAERAVLPELRRGARAPREEPR